MEFLSNGLDTESLGSDRSHGSGLSAIDDVVSEDDENYSFRARIISYIFLPSLPPSLFPFVIVLIVSLCANIVVSRTDKALVRSRSLLRICRFYTEMLIFVTCENSKQFSNPLDMRKNMENKKTRNSLLEIHFVELIINI